MTPGRSAIIRQKRPVAPLLRWAGSKAKLIPQLITHVPASYARYIEPFAGSGALFFAVRPKIALLGDKNVELMETYRTLRSHPVLLHRKLKDIPSGSEHYYFVRDSSELTDGEINSAARFIYLNRHCFNGVFRTNKNGKFNVPYGSRLGALPDQTQFLRCAFVLRSAELIAGDFETVAAQAVADDFVYLDPPYAKKDSRQRGEYGYSSFGLPDLKRLATVLDGINDRGATFLLSYADCDEISDIRAAWFNKTLQVRRHVAGFHAHRAIVSEVLISNRPLIPQ